MIQGTPFGRKLSPGQFFCCFTCDFTLDCFISQLTGVFVITITCNCAINRYASVYQSMTLTAVCHFIQAGGRTGGLESSNGSTCPSLGSKSTKLKMWYFQMLSLLQSLCPLPGELNLSEKLSDEETEEVGFLCRPTVLLKFLSHPAPKLKLPSIKP